MGGAKMPIVDAIGAQWKWAKYFDKTYKPTETKKLTFTETKDEVPEKSSTCVFPSLQGTCTEFPFKGRANFRDMNNNNLFGDENLTKEMQEWRTAFFESKRKEK